jgi:hypothetical protein
MSKFKVFATRLAIGGVALAAIIINTRSARSYDAVQAQNRPLELLQQAHSLSTELSPLDRTYALLFLLKNGEGIISDSQYRQWCSEVGQEARLISDGWDRVAHEKNSLLCLSKVDPIAALREYSTIEDPQPQVDGTFPEDVRADGALTVFSRAWNSQATIPAKFAVLRDIEAEASRIGRTGEYPYEGMARMIEAILATQADEATDRAEKIFRDALHSYRQEPHKFINRDEEFKRFLEATKDKIVDRALLAEATQVFVDKVLHSPKDMDYVSEIHTSKGTARFTNDKAELLFQEFPTVEKFVPALAAGLKRQNPELNKAVESMDKPITGGYVALDKDALAMQQMHSKIWQTNIVMRIPLPEDQSFTAAKLNEALTSVAGLSDEAIRIQGYCALVPHLLVKSRQTEAKQIYERERSRLEGLQSEDDHLKAAVALAKASQAVGNRPGFIDLTNTALREGTLLFQQDSRFRPQWPPTGRRGFRDLTDLVSFTAPQISEMLHPQIEHIEDPGLKADLLSFEARALKDAQTSK